YTNWTVVPGSGALPNGLTLNASSGAISGKPTTTTGSPFSFTVTVQDSAGNTSPGQALSIAIDAALTITTTSLPNGALNAAYPSTTLQAQGGAGGYTNWTVVPGSGALPNGLTLNAFSGAIGGTPTTTTGSPFSVGATVQASAGNTPPAQALSIAIDAALTITPTSLPNGTVGVAYAQTLAASGGAGGYTNWTVVPGSGALPNGLTLNAFSGAIGGTPTTTTGSPFSFSVTVQDTAGNTSPAHALSIAIDAALTITTTSLPNGTVGVAYAQTLAASGGAGGYTNWTVVPGSGALPNGLTLNAFSGAIGGTPTTTTGSPFSFSVTVQDTAGNTSPAHALSIAIDAALTITTTSLPNGTVGVAYAQTLAASGGAGGYTNWTVVPGSGALPNGLTLNAFSGAIGGTPTTTTGSPFSFSVTVQDTAGNTSPAHALSIAIDAALTITTTSLPNGTVGVAYAQTLAASGGAGGYTNWTVVPGSGALPNGLTLNAFSGAIGGTPTTTTGSPFSFSVTVQDTAGNTSPAHALSIAIDAALTITTTSLPNGTVGVAYAQTLAASGGAGGYTNWTVVPGSGALPNGLTLNAFSGAIGGTPTTTTGSPFSFSVTVQDTAGNTSPAHALSIAIDAALTITTTSLPNGTVGVAYAQTLAASGGAGGYTNWTVVPGSGALPNGLTLNAFSGAIGGTPTTTTGSPFSFSVTVQDTAGNTSPAHALSIAIDAALTITTTSLPNGTVGVAYAQTLAASGGAGGYTNWTVVPGSGALPNGLTLNASSGAISGKPTTTTGNPFSFSVTVQDSAGNTSPGQALSIAINAALTITTTSLPNGALNAVYPSTTLQAQGGAGGYTNWTVVPGSGALPNGLTLNASSGAISGKPTTTAGSSFSFS